jgi:hypothetical protein
MTDNLQEHKYPNDSGDIKAPPSTSQFENLYNLVCKSVSHVLGNILRTLIDPPMLPSRRQPRTVIVNHSPHMHAFKTFLVTAAI